MEHSGLEWITEFKPHIVAAHLHAIQQFPSRDSFSRRIKLLQYAISEGDSLEQCEKLFRGFLDDNEHDWAALCVGIAYNKIWESGNDFSRFDNWRIFAENLMEKHQLTSGVHCFLLLQHCWAEVAGRGNIGMVYANLTTLRNLAEKSRSPDRILMTSALAAYIYCWKGDLAAYEIIISDTDPYLQTDNLSPASSLQFMVSKGLFLTLQGNYDQAESLFLSLLDSPLIDQLPPSIWLMIHSHYLFCLVSQNKQSNIEETADKIRRKAIPDANHYYHSYLHYNLGIAALALGRPHKALLHSNEAVRRGEFCQSATCARMPALLYGQALSDLGNHTEAIEHFQEWLPKWKHADFFLLASLAYIEMASIYMKSGDSSRQYLFLEKAKNILPEKNTLQVMYRPQSFVKKLEKITSKTSHESHVNTVDIKPKPLQFKTLGNFTVEWHGKTLDEKIWKGKQARRLLQVLITLGGANVPAVSVADILWPDSDGDRALNSLKVAISRIRKAVREYIDTDWLQVKRHTISLTSSLCQVDCLTFEDGLKKSLSNGTDRELLIKTLNLYSGNYLENETTESWALQKRTFLRTKFLDGVFALQEYCMESGEIETAITYLTKALQFDSANEIIFEKLMDCCITQGRKAKALEYFTLAQKNFERDFGIQPGERLYMLEKIAKEK